MFEEIKSKPFISITNPKTTKHNPVHTSNIRLVSNECRTNCECRRTKEHRLVVSVKVKQSMLEIHAVQAAGIGIGPWRGWLRPCRVGTPVKQINPFCRRPRGSWSVASASKRFNLVFRRWEQFSNVVVFLSPSLPSPREYPLYDSPAVAVLSSGISSLVRERKRDRRRELISTRISVFLSRTSQHVDNEHPYIREHRRNRDSAKVGQWKSFWPCNYLALHFGWTHGPDHRSRCG